MRELRTARQSRVLRDTSAARTFKCVNAPADPTPATLKDLIEETRIARLLTPAEASRQIGISPTLFSRWRRGTAGISIDHLDKLAAWLRIPLGRLMPLAGYPETGEWRASNEPLADARKSAIDEAWNIMDEHRRELIYELAQTAIARHKVDVEPLDSSNPSSQRPNRHRPSLSVRSMIDEFGLQIQRATLLVFPRPRLAHTG